MFGRGRVVGFFTQAGDLQVAPHRVIDPRERAVELGLIILYFQTKNRNVRERLRHRRSVWLASMRDSDQVSDLRGL